MRAVLAFFTLTACAGPTGLEQTWPPKRGLAVEAVVTGDLDGDATPEVIVAASGGAHEAGLYRIEGTTDLALGTASPVRSFTTYTPVELGHPSAALFIGGGDPTVDLAYTDTFDEIGISTLSSQLELPPGLPSGSGIPAGNAVLWLALVTFPNNTPNLVVSNGTAMQHMGLYGNDPNSVPPPTGTGWPTAELALTYTAAANLRLAVATPTQVFQTSLAATAITWPEPPIVHAPWIGQVALDLDGNGRDELVGFDPQQHAVCALDLVTATPQCFALTTTFAGTEVTIALAKVAGGAAPDLVIAQATNAETDATIVVDPVLSGSGITAGGTMPRTVPVAHGRLVIVNAGPGTPDTALVLGADGTVACAAGGC